MKNHSLEEMHQIARDIFTKAVSAVDPSKRLADVLGIEQGSLAVRMDGHRRDFDLGKFERVLLVGAGKAAASMARAAEEILGSRISKGIITTKYGHTLPLK